MPGLWAQTQPRVSVYRADESGILVNSFLLDTDAGVVLVDGQMLPSHAAAVVQAIQAMRKTLVGIIMTHAHADHYNGLPTIRRTYPDAPLYATAGTISDLVKLVGDRNVPVEIPTKVLTHGETLSIGGLDIVVDETDHNEAEHLTMLYLPEERALIASDLLYSGCHAWLSEGESTGWINDLEDVRLKYSDAKTVYAGHGGAGGTELFDQQQTYLEAFQKTVAAYVSHEPFGNDQRERIRAGFLKQYPGYPMQGLLTNNINAVYEELKSLR